MLVVLLFGPNVSLELKECVPVTWSEQLVALMAPLVTNRLE